jgi:hypothetical protein
VAACGARGTAAMWGEGATGLVAGALSATGAAQRTRMRSWVSVKRGLAVGGIIGEGVSAGIGA